MRLTPHYVRSKLRGINPEVIKTFLNLPWIPTKLANELNSSSIAKPVKKILLLPPSAIHRLTRESSYNLRFKHIKRLTPEQINALNSYDINPKTFEKNNSIRLETSFKILKEKEECYKFFWLKILKK